MASLGLSGNIYRLTTGSRATWGAADANGLHAGAAPASLDVIGNARDVTLNIESSEADVSTRANAGWGAVLAALKKPSIDIQMVYDPTDADFLALMKAYLANSLIALAMLDGDKATTGVVGFWADFAVTKYEKSEPIDGAQMITWTVKPGLSAVPPEMVKTS